MPDALQDIALTTKEMMEVEGELIALSLENVTYGTLEADWAALSMEKKKELALEGLYRGACAAPRDNSRSSCPEMTVAGLVGDGEYNLINLLKRLIEHDPTGNNRVKELFLFAHPYIDHQFRHSNNAPEQLKSFLYRCVLLRNFYILETLFGIIQAYHGRPPRKIIPTQLHDKHCHGPRTEAERKAIAKHGKVDNSQCKEQAAVAGYACYTCHKQTDDRDTLKRCGQCQGAWYCSKECQKADWTAHKKFCGKKRFDPKLFTREDKEPEYFIGCPAVAPGFTRSPSLWRQIKWLCEPDSQWRDYHIMRNHKDPSRSTSLRIFCPRARLTFLVARRRALASGSIPAIYKMLEIISWQAHTSTLTMTQVQRQFELDYPHAAPLDVAPAAIYDAAEDFAPPTTQEKEEEKLFDEQRMASHPVPPEQLEMPGFYHP
ncbi:hypothetical protein K438DRAFT_1987247 [Mycena galopus ATCC 62051]|nr:hypothetical protein K438DRAFT_1987247 [Mycena galopus ATCC 62051]